MKIKTILKNIFSIVLATAIAATTFSFNSSKAMAWEQGANGSHEEINKAAVIRFLGAATSSAKFANSPINTTQQFLGNETTSATLAASGFTIQKSSKSFSQWVTHGGFSADEPEVWACVRHFYDPISANGVPQLTDHLALHGFVYDTISAKDWAFTKEENPYGWSKALQYYKMSMEIPDDSKITAVKGIDFRDPDIAVNSAAEARSAYLGKAFRALGETMHMFGDITQPAHVRNDSHPAIDTDPLESTVNKDTILIVKNGPVVPEMSSAIDSPSNLESMYETIARYTNKTFYTDDTIYDKASGVTPSNYEAPYPHPQFSDLILEKGSGPKVYSQTFNGKNVRMIEQTYTSYLTGKNVSGLDYFVPPSFAEEQAGVLVPIAIKANTKVINAFFPTFDLTLDLKQNKDASTNGDANYREYSVDTQLKHLTETDIEWQKPSLAIKYAGPAELWGETSGKARKIADLKFKGGAPLNPLTVFVGDEKYQKADKYQINNTDKIYVVINAGGRVITSKKFAIDAPVLLTINPSPQSGEPNKDYTFTAKTNIVVENARYDWFLNGKNMQSGASNTFKFQPKQEDTYALTAKVFDKAGKELSSGQAMAYIQNATTSSIIKIDLPAVKGEPNKAVTFRATATGLPPDVVYKWMLAGGEVLQNNGSNTFGYTFTKTGIYTMWVQAFDSKGKFLEQASATATIQNPVTTTTVSASVLITVNLPKSSTPGVNYDAIAKQPFTLTANGVSGPVYVWKISQDGSNWDTIPNSNSSSISYTLDSGMIRQFRVELQDKQGAYIGGTYNADVVKIRALNAATRTP